jgi:NADH dehydrogenase FAD-containing subunit
MRHVHFLHHWAQRPLPDLQVTLVATRSQTYLPAMVPAWVAGQCSDAECTIALEPLVQRAGVAWLQQPVASMEADAQTLTLGDGSAHPYTWLSLDGGPALNRQQLEDWLPGAREFAVVAYPQAHFAELWPRVCAMAETQPLRIAVIGDHPAALELALAAKQRLPHSTVTVLLQPASPDPGANAPGMAPLLAQLKRQQITVLQDVVLRLDGRSVHLACGAELLCDVPLVAMQRFTAPWLADSGLALDATGAPATDAYARSTSHPSVFVAGDNTRAWERNLRATAQARTLHVNQADTGLRLWFAGEQSAMAQWGPWCGSGRGWHWLKTWRDRTALRRYQR